MKQSTLEAEISLLRQTLDRLQADKMAATTKLIALQTQVKEFEMSKAHLEAEVATLRRQLHTAHSLRGDLAAEITALHEQLKAVQSENCSYETEVLQLRSNLDAMNRQYNALQAEKATVEIARLTLRSQLVAMQEEFQHERAQFEAEIDRLQTALSFAQVEQAALETQVSDLQQQLVQLAAIQAEKDSEALTATAIEENPVQTPYQQLEQIEITKETTKDELAAELEQLRQRSEVSEVFEVFDADDRATEASSPNTSDVPRISPLLESESTCSADPLRSIDGVGPVYEQYLFAAGIYTFAALADLTPEWVHTLVNPDPKQSIQPESWIAEARRMRDERAR